MTYTKLPVSSLELKAVQGDLKACIELRNRCDQGLKRARLARERLVDTTPENFWQKIHPILFPSDESAQTNRPTTPDEPTIDDYKRHNRQLAKGIPTYKTTTVTVKPEMIPACMDKLIETIEREEFARYGDLTAQQIFDRDRRNNK